MPAVLSLVLLQLPRFPYTTLLQGRAVRLLINPLAQNLPEALVKAIARTLLELAAPRTAVPGVFN